jgi:hypothetical protein
LRVKRVSMVRTSRESMMIISLALSFMAAFTWQNSGSIAQGGVRDKF